jgi:hypothetical protein
MLPGPQIVPRDQLATHLANLLLFLYGGPNLPAGVHAQFHQRIKALADTAPNRAAVLAHAGQQNINLAGIRGLAPQIAPTMDAFFGGYNVLWDNNKNAYNFAGSAQTDAWGIVVEDINSTRKYCVRPNENIIEQMLSNLLNLLKRVSRPL